MIVRAARNDHFWFVLERQLFDFFVVDALVFFAHTVGDEFVHAAGKIQRMTVSQVAAVRKIHAKNGVSRLERRHVDGHVGGSAGVCLNVGVLRAEKFLGAIDGQLFDLVGVFAAAVVALAGVALGVLIRKDRAHGFEAG